MYSSASAIQYTSVKNISCRPGLVAQISDGDPSLASFWVEAILFPLVPLHLLWLLGAGLGSWLTWEWSVACDGGCVSPCDPGPGGERAVEGDEPEMRTTRRCYIASIVLQLLTIIITRSHAPNKCTTDKYDRGSTSYFPMSSSHLNTLKQSYISKMI